MNHSDADRALALAGVFNAATLVDQVAYSAEPDAATLAAALEPLFRFDAPSVEAVYGGASNLRAGLEALGRALGTPGDGPDARVTHYVLGLLRFERTYSDDPAMQDALRTMLRRAQLQAEGGDLGAEQPVVTLAEGWSKTLGTIRPRIVVNGEPTRLQTPRNVSLIRALLLSGLRSAVLWRQTGGSRWALLFGRARLRREAQRLLAA